MLMIVNRNYICKDEFKDSKNKEKYFKDCIESKDNKYKSKKKKKYSSTEMKCLDKHLI